MADTTDVVFDDEMIDPVTGEIIDQKELAQRLLAQAKDQGVSICAARFAGLDALPFGRADRLVELGLMFTDVV